MKNLLVDALRQASAEDDADTPPPAAPPESVRPDVADAAAEAVQPTETPADSLELIDGPTAPPRLEAPSSDVAEAPSREVIDTESAVPGASASDAAEAADAEEPDVVDPAMLLPALDVEAAAAEPARQPLPVARPRRDRLMLLGRWSPVLCLAAASLAAGSYSLYQTLAASSLVDLDGLSVQSDDSAAVSEPLPKWQTLAAAPVATSSRPPAVTAAPDDSVPAAPNGDTSVTALGGSKLEPRETRSGTVVIDAYSPPEDAAFDEVQAAYAAYSAGDFERAERGYRDALAIDPNHRHALAGLAAVLQRLSRGEEARAVYEQILRVDPRDTAAAAALLAGDESDESRLKLLLQRHPDAPALHFAMGLRLAEQSRWPEAYAAFLDAKTLVPANADYSYNVAVSAARLGKVDEARAHYEQALQSLTPESSVDPQTIEDQLRNLGTGERT